MCCPRSPRRHDTGAFLVVVLLTLLALLGLGMLGLFLTSGTIKVATNINLSNQARVVAEAGIERAREILFDSSHPLPLPALLAGSGDASDEVTHDTSRCQGENRGAVLVDYRVTPSPHLRNVTYPTIDRRSDLPTSAGQSVSARLGSYTVYVRQDLRDCRMGNFTCDYVPDAGSSPYGATACSPSPGQPEPNHYVVVRSEGVAVDGASTEVVEVTWRLGHVPPASTGGAGGESGTGGTAGVAGGTGGSAGSSGPGGAGGAGSASGAGGSGGSSPGPCLNYAVTAVSPCPNGWAPGCITINASSKVDGFSSSLGPYGGGNAVPAGVAMTCSAAMAGGSCPNNCPSGCITGPITYGHASTFNSGTLPVPSHSVNSTRVTVPANKTLSPATPSSVAYFEELTVDTGGTLTLTAGRHVVNYLNLNQHGTLYVDDTQGPVTVWILSFVGLNSTVTVKSGKAQNFWLVYDGTNQINNNTNNSFTGVIFAPAAEVNLNYAVTGAVVGGKVTLNGPSKVHFDTTLKCP